MSDASRPPGPRRGNWLAAAVAALLALAVAEGVLRLLDIPPSRPFLQEFYGPHMKLMAWDRNPSGAFDLDLRDPAVRARYAPRLGAAFEEHWSETPFAVEVSYNSRGFRERELEPRRPGRRRIAAIGDSFTYGHGLPEADTWPRQLEAILNQRAPGRDEVYNWGFSGGNIDGIAQVGRWALELLEADVLVYAYFPNDPAPAQSAPEGGHPMLDPGWLHARESDGHVRMGVRSGGGLRLAELVARPFEARRVTATTLAWYRGLHEESAWRETGRAIAALQEGAVERGARFVWVLLPLIYRLDDEPPLAELHTGLLRFADERGIEVLDALPRLRGYGDRELSIHPHDRHPSPLYARLVAEAVAERLLGPGGGAP